MYSVSKYVDLLEPNQKNLNEYKPILSATKM